MISSGVPSREHRALHQHGDLLGEAEHHVHVVLDDQNGDVGVEAGHDVEDQMAFRRRHAGRRLVEQQHARALRQRDGDLDQALAAIWQFAHQLERVVGQPQRVEMIERLVEDRALGADRAPEIVGVAVALGDHHADVLQNGQPAEQLVDLEGAREPAARALGLRQLAVISTPSSTTRPEDGLSAPVIRLTSVVLPAPFGPISARRAPRSSVRLTSRVTRSAPKLRLRPLHLKGGASRAHPLY